MEEYRLKIITEVECNITLRQGEKGTRSRDIGIFNSESACDYNIIIVDFAAVQASDIININKQDFIDFFNKPSIILCISYKEYYNPNYKTTNFDWLPNKKQFNVINKEGESLRPTKEVGNFFKLFNSYDWTWKCYFNILDNKSASYFSIAENISGQSIALMSKINKGKIIIIPIPKISTLVSKKHIEEYSNFLRTLIDLCENEIKELTTIEHIEPDWVEKYVMDNDTKIRKEIIDLQKKYESIKEARKLFYEMSKPLTKAVYLVLKEMGFDPQMREDEGIWDIEVQENDCNFVIEVTSSEESWINIEKTRQLADWYSRFKKENANNLKGLMIANPYCNNPPTERDEPFTPAALKHGEREDFCLMTTLQLYEIFFQYINKKIDKKDIKKLLMGTKGLLTY